MVKDMDNLGKGAVLPGFTFLVAMQSTCCIYSVFRICVGRPEDVQWFIQLWKKRLIFFLQKVWWNVFSQKHDPLCAIRLTVGNLPVKSQDSNWCITRLPRSYDWCQVFLLFQDAFRHASQSNTKWIFFFFLLSLLVSTTSVIYLIETLGKWFV